MKAEEIWDSCVVIIQGMVLTLRQNSSCPKTHLQGHVVLHLRFSSLYKCPCSPKGSESRASDLELRMGSVADRPAHELCCSHLQRTFPHSPAGLAGCRALLKGSALGRKGSDRQCHWRSQGDVAEDLISVPIAWQKTLKC